MLMTRSRRRVCGAIGSLVAEWMAYADWSTLNRYAAILHNLAGDRMRFHQLKRREFIALVDTAAVWALASCLSLGDA